MKLISTSLFIIALLYGSEVFAESAPTISDQAKKELESIELNNGFTAYDYVKLKANFNSNYEVVEWTCGAPCTQSVVINLKSGELVGDISSCYGLEYELSRNTIAFVNIEDDPMQSCKNDKVFVLDNEKLIEKT